MIENEKTRKEKNDKRQKNRKEENDEKEKQEKRGGEKGGVSESEIDKARRRRQDHDASGLKKGITKESH